MFGWQRPAQNALSIYAILRRNSVATMAESLPKITSVLIDLSGTLHIEDQAIPGSQEALVKLRSSGVKVKFVTNTTKEPLRLLHERLKKLSFDVQRHEMFTSLTAASQLIRERQLRPLLYIDPSAREDFIGIEENDPNAVVVGLAPECFNYSPMNRAFRLLLDGASLIAIHKARYFKKKDGMYLGPGAFITGLEYATDTKAEIVGKPEKTFFHSALKDLGGDPKSAIMIGDDARDDIGGAMSAGLMGILVQTGKYRCGDESKLDVPPSAVCKDFAAAVDFIINHNKSDHS